MTCGLRNSTDALGGKLMNDARNDLIRVLRQRTMDGLLKQVVMFHYPTIFRDGSMWPGKVTVVK